MTPLQALIGIKATTPLIQAALNDLSQDLSPIRNLELDRQRIRERLQPSDKAQDELNAKRRNNKQYLVGDFVLLHRASKLHASKSEFEFLGPYEIMNITEFGRYELRRVGPGKKNIIKAAKEQLRLWPSDWSLATNLNDLLDLFEANEKVSGIYVCEL